MAALVVALLLIALLFGAGFAINVLWYVAIVALVLWMVGFLVRPSGNGRWYYW